MSSLRLQALQTHHLQPIDLEVAAGECVGLYGASGSGKTLLLRAVADLDPHGGQVLLDGVACSRFTPPEWRRRVAFLPAESPWWHATVGEHFQNPSPEGLQQLGFEADVLQWQVERLSSGERQRLALLRMLGNEPDALLLDEPSANLDPASVGLVEQLVQAYRTRRHAAVLWVSHDASQLERVTARALRMRGGALELAA